MIKPEGYDEAKAFTGDSMTLPPGGYICRILRANEETSKSGRQMLVIAFDICEGVYEDFYSSKHAAAKEKNHDARWPGMFYQLTEGVSLPYFKGVITAIEESNPGFTWMWDEKALAGRKFGGIFGREEFETQNGETVMVTKLQYIRSVAAILNGDFRIPPDKPLKGGSGGAAPAVVSGGFTENGAQL